MLAIDLGGAWAFLRFFVPGQDDVSGGMTATAQAIDTEETEGFAVIELFTSEGCSSCPSADKLLAEIHQRYGDEEVYPLSFHVDYWNRLGWKDPFSQKAFSDRQRNYSRILNDRVYTPMMVFNGQKALVGSRTQEVYHGLRQALETQPQATISLSAPEWKEKTLKFSFSVSGIASGDVVHLALVQRSATVEVPRGENTGRTLHHANVVRAFSSYSLAERQSGLQLFTLPEAVGSEEFSIVAYVQDFDSAEIKGATRMAL
ncbi:MAG TPA: DUF1223 domain-containing protein [Cytophagales bacterium]|nr:DUF1223 domain-containing protein [Cytophagales bacterium]HAA18429.1 DUF1223 domain-containing protein [Cytophagales bacterium]HAP61476.1 DUF1223 domain-containing protein [Cytophagales bacterium]